MKLIKVEELKPGDIILIEDMGGHENFSHVFTVESIEGNCIALKESPYDYTPETDFIVWLGDRKSRPLITPIPTSTIKLSAQEERDALGRAFKKAGVNAYFANGFKAGISFILDRLAITRINEQK